MSESKPKISDLKKGIITCPACSKKFSLDKFTPLKVATCTSCSNPLFIPLKIKHYWLYRPLGGGGMGSVYRALSEENDSGEFAIKILPRQKKDDQDLIKTLMMEGEVGKILGKSPHIVEVVDYGLEDGEYFMASRFVEGTRLDIFISSASKLSEKQALDIMVQVIEAEIHIKNCGFLFRDMKPENIIIVEETSSAKLFDFGLCMSLERAANPNPEDHLEGSPYYLPPERIVAAPEGEYSEVYSLGMLLFHMLTGTTYFSQADIKDLVTKHVRSLRVASVNTRLKHCSPEIINIIDKMIKRDPNQRYHTLSEVLDLINDLSKNASGYPLSSAPEKRAQIQNRKKSFKPVSILIYFFIALILIAAVYGGWVLRQKAERERKLLAVTKQVSDEMDIPVNIKKPALSIGEIQKMIKTQTAEQLKDQIDKLETFNKSAEIAEICDKRSINIEKLQRAYVPFEEVKKRMKRELNARIEKKMKSIPSEFSKDRAEQEIARQMKIKLPVRKPAKNEKEIKLEAVKETIKEINEKFPIKLLSKANMDILKKYKCYKVGDRVSVPSKSGDKVEGIYQGISGRKIVVGEHKVLLADLPGSISIKFNPALASKRIQDEIKRAKKEYTSKKLKYQKSIYNSVLEKLYKQNGYIKVKKRWVPAANEFNKRLREKEKKFNNENLDKEENIIKSVKREFNEDEFYRKAGYRKLGNIWCTEKEMVDTLLKKKKKQFDLYRKKQIKELEEETRNSIEVSIYEKNGYVYRNGKWQSAKKLLDDAVQKKMQRSR